MIDNEYLLQEELVEDVTAKVLEEIQPKLDEIQPKLDVLATSYGMLCQSLAKIVLDVGVIEARQEGKSEEEIKVLKDLANTMMDNMKKEWL